MEKEGLPDLLSQHFEPNPITYMYLTLERGSPRVVILLLRSRLSLERRHCFPAEAPLNHNVGECSMSRNCSTISKYTIAIVHYLRRFDSTNPKGLVDLRLHMAPTQSEAGSDTAQPTPHDGADLAQVCTQINPWLSTRPTARDERSLFMLEQAFKDMAA